MLNKEKLTLYQDQLEIEMISVKKELEQTITMTKFVIFTISASSYC